MLDKISKKIGFKLTNDRLIGFAILVSVVMLGSTLIYGYSRMTQSASSSTDISTGKDSEPAIINSSAKKEDPHGNVDSIDTGKDRGATLPPPVAGYDHHISVVCNDSAIPYRTYYSDSSLLNEGVSKVTRAGIEGVARECKHTYDGKDWGSYYGHSYLEKSTINFPTDEWIDRGTKPIAYEDPVGTTYTYAQAISMAQSSCSPIAQASGSNSSAYLVCISTSLRQYGY